MNILKTLASLAFSTILFNSCAQTETKAATESLYDISIKSLEGDVITLADYKEKFILFVNVASECGFTPQYKDLQELHNQYKDQLVIIGVPCNQFGKQEPGNADEIKTFCQKNYGVEFLITEKIDVKGENQHPLYTWLTLKENNGIKSSSVKWNFQKYLVGKDGKFIEPFNYKFSGGMGARKFYSENNAWTYRWDVQHNVKDLIKLMGGNESFVNELNGMFSEPLGRSKYEFYAQLPDQTGNVGQFTMANEPSLHIPYLYNYAGQPWKTQKRIRTLLNQWFRDDLMGVPGDEDGGGMTAFVVFSQLGFYPVTPGMPMYNIGSPVFENAIVHLENGSEFKITTKNYAPENKYIQSAKLNGKEWNQPWFAHSDISNGGTLELVMGDKANKSWGSHPDNAPPSAD